ncbi:hypothetical protein BHY_1429 (plasmid) [Borrelia nietonii YOR]|uniref:Uncharacterized protein n=2 Tax=Borrelia TaxID=138 RepID=W5SBC8_9SPIR|nr:hypothetical protein BHY_1429 [Borrelia nietonii YOR]AHH14795.1 hypothetical protein BHW_0900067 [Borrelia hermsii MTW]
MLTAVSVPAALELPSLFMSDTLLKGFLSRCYSVLNLFKVT